MIAVLRQKHAFDSIHSPTAYADPLSYLEKGIRTPRRGLRQNSLDAFDLFVGNWQARPVHTHKTVHTLHLVHAGSVFRAQKAADEHIAAEQRYFYFLLAIAPAMHFHRGRHVRFHALIA